MGAILSGAGHASGASTKSPDTTRLVVYVAPDGNDTWTGSESRPFATLERARDAVRHATGRSRSPWTTAPASWTGAEIVLRGGIYRLESALMLDGRDSGSPEHRIVYRSADGEVAVLNGSVPIRRRDWMPVADPRTRERLQSTVRGLVREFDLEKLGVRDLGTIGEQGKRLELFAGGKPMPMARWPNDGWAHIKATLGATPTTTRTTTGCIEGYFAIQENRPRTWADIGNVWLEGFWYWDYFHGAQRIEAIDETANAVRLSEPWTSHGYRAGQRLAALNAPEEIDVAGEWAIDFQRRKLLFLPLSDDSLASTEVSVAGSLVVASGVTDVSLISLGFESCRRHGVAAYDSSGIELRGLKIRSCGGWGIRLESCERSRVTDVEVENSGQGGVFASGGDRPTLRRSDNTIDRCRLVSCGRIDRTNQAGVEVRGVGATVRQCIIEDAPHQAILFWGNDHLVERNTIRRVCLETGDAGAIYSGLDWTFRGNVVQDNEISDVTGFDGEGAAIYLDDCFSGGLVRRNHIARCGQGVVLGGGRDNEIIENRFEQCATPVRIGDRTWATEQIRPGGAWGLFEKLEAMPFRSEVWSARYPKLASILAHDPREPVGNRIEGNDFLEHAARVRVTRPVARVLDGDQMNRDSVGAARSLGHFVLVQ